MTLPPVSTNLRDEKLPNLLPRESRGAPVEPPPPVRPRHKVERGRKNVSRACQACRQRRIRCTAERPCRPCIVNNIECVDDGGPEGVDLRTIRLGPHNQNIYIQQKTLLDSLIQAIRAGTAQDVLQCIQEGGSLGEIAQVLRSMENSPVPMHAVADSSKGVHLKSEDDRDEVIESAAQFIVGSKSKETKPLRNFGNLPMSSAIKTNGFSPTIQDRQIMHMSSPVWECTPLLNDELANGDILSRTCLTFRDLARQQLAQGMPPKLVLSLDGIDMDLFFRNRTPEDPHTVSTWACELMKTFDILTPVTKLAGAEAVATLMRWLVAPTKENYMALPVTSRPIESQFFIPHPIGADIMIFPAIREVLLRSDVSAWTDMIDERTMDWNWPYSIDACLEQGPSQGSRSGSPLRLSKAFVEHIRNLDNISFDRKVLKTFPDFDGKLRWHDSVPPEDSTVVDGDDSQDNT